MIILGIESSCDETATAIVENGRKVHASVICSQALLHAATGGVVPEVAAREHVVKIKAVIEEALKKANLKMEQIEAIAVTAGPGLLSSLMTGCAAAASLALKYQKKLIPVNHIAGHIYANWLDLPDDSEVAFPVVILTVSGGHNELVLMRGHFQFELLGQTYDDSAGEAFDKVARMLGLGYPGGPAISKAAINGNPSKFRFPRAMLQQKNADFSFSGLKTAVRQLIEAESAANGKLSESFIADVAASFEECVDEILSVKLMKTAIKNEAKEIHLAGGVSANSRLRKMIEEAKQDFTLRYSRNLHYCTDNAAMIAAAAYFQNQYQQNFSTNPRPNPQLNLYQNTNVNQ